MRPLHRTLIKPPPRMPDAPPAADLQPMLRVLDERRLPTPELALVLGSGLGELADEVEDARVVPTAALPGYPRSTVAGHAGRLVFGKLEGRSVLFLQGRVHLYEGHDARALGVPVRLMHALGARCLLVTNAAGGIDPSLTPGTLMFITDHVNLAFANPLSGPNPEGGPRFPDMSAPYDPEWLDRAERAALALGIPTRRGVYLWTRGPSYETRAEIRAFARLGADAVGMSTVPEVLQARHLGMRVLGISTITNPAAGIGSEPLDHDDVLTVGRRVRQKLTRLVRKVVREA